MTDGELHCHVDNLSRRKEDGTERSAVATAAYISGTDLWNEREGRLTRFGGRPDVVLSTLTAPDGAPDWSRNRETLWNTVERNARRRDARLAKTIDAAIPRAIRSEDWLALMRAYVASFVALGMVADAAIHEDGTGYNPHLHVLLTVNALTPNGFGAKLTAADHKSFVTQARTGWEAICNTYLAAAGALLRLDGRSYKARGIPKKPTTHRGPDRQERQAKRAHARRVREETLMSRGIRPVDRHTYPLLSVHDGWPFPDNVAPADLTSGQADEFRQLAAARLAAAERAAERTFRDRGVGPWFTAVHGNDPASPDPEPAERPPASDVAPSASPAPTDSNDWYLEVERPAPPVADRPPVREDFATFSEAFQAERIAYERDLWRRAVDLPRTREETELMRRAEAHSPQMRKLMENQLFDRRVMRLRQEDDARSLEAFEARLGPALLEPFEDYAREDGPEPVPGPYGQPTHPHELRREQEEMLATYEEEEPDRGR